ncbi:response regulator transcription factor [Periweissella cryptocerci]|uniref:Response regulator transcription factor n=1 Tax=Periweissella cryptocerci TaxID=2506420 RepID=A0A4V1AIQ1_9LACO|nr:LytTR family DNA-binding domain-containing protein [Periweissella cryptocerci]QBO36285.1 response regulator transcription factor [Periweissella cryptocerci]
MHTKLNTIIIDDDDISIKSLTTLLAFYNNVNVLNTFNSFSSAWQYIKENYENIDVLFLDIILTNENGVAIGKKIKEHYPQINLVFCTSDPSFALDAYDTEPVDYITKPIDAVRLQDTIERLNHIVDHNVPILKSENVKIGIKVQNVINMIPVNEIVSINKSLRKVRINLTDNTSFTTNETMQELYDKLHNFGFITITRSSLIPISRIEKIEYDRIKQNYKVLLSNNEEITGISKRRLTNVKEDLAYFNWII